MRIANIRQKVAVALARQDQTIYVIGSGPSMRLFPVDFFRHKVTIALNQAWRYFYEEGPTLTLTAHPELYQSYTDAGSPVKTLWVVKKKPPMDHLELDSKGCYVFGTTPEWSAFWERPADTLFIGRGIQLTAFDLAARLGAHTIITVGVDMCSLDGEHHGHTQDVQFHGLSPAQVYSEYLAWSQKARTVLMQRFAVQVLTLTPFLGVNSAEEDYKYLCNELKLDKLPEPRDISRYMRPHTDSPDGGPRITVSSGK